MLYKKYREAKASGKYTQKELNKQFYPNDRRVRDEMIRHREDWQKDYASRMIDAASVASRSRMIGWNVAV